MLGGPTLWRASTPGNLRASAAEDAGLHPALSGARETQGHVIDTGLPAGVVRSMFIGKQAMLRRPATVGTRRRKGSRAYGQHGGASVRVAAPGKDTSFGVLWAKDDAFGYVALRPVVV